MSPFSVYARYQYFLIILVNIVGDSVGKLLFYYWPPRYTLLRSTLGGIMVCPLSVIACDYLQSEVDVSL